MSRARPRIILWLCLCFGIALGASACGSGGPSGATGTAPRCVAPGGASTTPQSITGVITLINALPNPVTLPCFLQALARPLKMHATVSLISAQPSGGARSPRIFLFSDGLRMSVVPVGPGSALLEMGEIRNGVRSIKAEVAFPVMGPLPIQTPFDRIMYVPNVTGCAFCHPGEELATDVTFAEAWSSLALRPAPFDGVAIDFLSAETAACDPAAETDRCAMLHALFDEGPLPVEQAFPDDLATIQ
jgi:hypothetical protein